MKTITHALGVSIACLLLFGCNSTDQKAEADRQQQAAAQKEQAEKAQKVARAKQEALQEFENFRRAGSYMTGFQSLLAMDQTLARAGLNSADINANQNELAAHLRDLVRRPVAKPKPKAAARSPKNRRRRG